MNPIEVRCKGCNRWLATATVMVAAIKCPRCKMVYEYKVFNNLQVTSSYDMIINRVPETTPQQADTSVKR